MFTWLYMTWSRHRTFPESCVIFFMPVLSQYFQKATTVLNEKFSSPLVFTASWVSCKWSHIACTVLSLASLSMRVIHVIVVCECTTVCLPILLLNTRLLFRFQILRINSYEHSMHVLSQTFALVSLVELLGHRVDICFTLVNMSAILLSILFDSS
jgi:hypothetical protein